jgi:hypothetical protein
VIRREDLRKMSPAQIVEAQAKGKLDHLLKGTENTPEIANGDSADQGARGESQQGLIDRGALQSMTTSAIVKAHREGRLDHLLRGDDAA